jgi:hypothetical protein
MKEKVYKNSQKACQDDKEGTEKIPQIPSKRNPMRYIFLALKYIFWGILFIVVNLVILLWYMNPKRLMSLEEILEWLDDSFSY